VNPSTSEALRAHIGRLYAPDVADETSSRLIAIVERFGDDHPELVTPREPYDERDVWIIAYGDHLTEPGRAPLATLEDVLSTRLGDVVGGLHLLPHYPSTSDGGFAVVDHERVDPRLGDWDDVERLAGGVRLMLDAVVNHTSASSPWFLGWLTDDPEFADFYLCPDDTTDLDQVVRPRTNPLLTPFEAADGTRHVWTTFGPDQVDLNFANPEVLIRITQVLLGYVARGASALRLDAIAFLWKRSGTTCIHLPETHEIIRLWRTILDEVAPGTLIVTETNVPHAENLSYFGDGTDEAHLVYQFALPPLVLHAFRRADTSVLRGWLDGLTTPTRGTSFLLFLASHDGIGLRPVEQLVPAEEIESLARAIESEGGAVSYRSASGDRRSPYELNVSYFDALSPPASSEPLQLQVDRFIAAQSLLLALAGIPAIYLHSLLGSRNWYEGPSASGHPRDINREKLPRAVVESELDDPTSLRAQVHSRMRARMSARIADPAFHPAAEQRVLSTTPGVLGFERGPAGARGAVLCLVNVTDRAQQVPLTRADGLTVSGTLEERCTGRRIGTDPTAGLDLVLEPYEVLWLGSPINP
jgi:glucosylglycerate phosphorylase